MDKIWIRDLALRTIIGTYPEERRDKQEVILNIALHADLSRAGNSDNLDDTVDYKAIKKRVVAMVENSEFLLLERLAGEVAAICLDDAKVDAVQVVIDKPGALRFARSAAVEIFRTRDK